jgi:SnoaL-like domain
MDRSTPVLDRLDIIDTCNAMAWHADRRNWAAVLGLFTDQVRLDYTSLNGGEPSTLITASKSSAVTAGG